MIMPDSMSQLGNGASGGGGRVRGPVGVILAAGKGTRMKSDLPKVVHEVADRPMVAWVVDACRAAGFTRTILIVGHKQEVVREVFEGDRTVDYAVQAEQLGTGHAVQCAIDLLRNVDGEVVVLAGDGPLVRAETLKKVIDKHRASKAAATIATSVVDDPTGYGRIIRDANGRFAAIVEDKDATDAQKKVREINPSIYCFDAHKLVERLPRLSNANAKGEYYLTDIPGMLRDDGEVVEVVDAMPPEDILSINTPEQLGEVDSILRGRLRKAEGARA
jgi:bifunctional UDP-N-acetylglucosamine pyrophosphorylase/glucosamine-1-phosphate N-acetyltransferase